MEAQKRITVLATRLQAEILLDAKQEPTYGQALKKLKHDQDKAADYLEPGCPIEVGRAIARLTNAIYGEAINQIYNEAKSQPIKEVPSDD